MKNEFYLPFLFILWSLTSCINGSDNSLTTDSATSQDSISGDTSMSGKDRAIKKLPIADSSKFYFFVENLPGTVDYQRMDFDQNLWKSLPHAIQQSFIGGPLHMGRMIHLNKLWRDSAWHLLYGKHLERGMVLEVKPLALVEINDDPSQSLYIMIPTQSEYQMSTCNSFDEWFTHCNDHRFFVQYWIEHQFTPRYIQRIQWKKFDLESIPAL